jgi:GH43 family beta-xylosidase
LSFLSAAAEKIDKIYCVGMLIKGENPDLDDVLIITKYNNKRKFYR